MVLNRESRIASITKDQQNIQVNISDLEKLQRKQRQIIFEVEDEVIEKCDKLIDALEQELKQTKHVDELFTIRWKAAY